MKLPDLFILRFNPDDNLNQVSIEDPLNKQRFRYGFEPFFFALGGKLTEDLIDKVKSLLFGGEQVIINYDAGKIYREKKSDTPPELQFFLNEMKEFREDIDSGNKKGVTQW